MKKIAAILTSIVTALFLVALPAFAHVVVRPNEVGVAAFQTFTMGVPNEKDNPTIELRLVIPGGLQYVSPNVKPGWTIDVKEEGEGEDAKVTEISWTGGSIPVGQRDDFFFSAKVPAEETTLQWKAYQTYQDGSIVSWAEDPESMKNLSDEQKEENEKTGKGPYSQTKVINDLTDTSSTGTTTTKSASTTDLTGRVQMLTYLSGASIVLSVIAIGMAMKKRK